MCDPITIPARGRIALATGGYFDLEAPEASALPIAAIAHSLARICRFTGHGRFYSVAEHSVHASRLVRLEHARAALLHDAAEAVIGDVAAPLKALLPDYRALESRVAAAVLGQYGLPARLPAEVKAADLRMLAAEQVQVMGNLDAWAALEGVPPAPVRLEFWPPDQAARAFLARWDELTAALIGGTAA